MYLKIRSKTVVVISCNDTSKNKMKKRFRSVAKTTTLGRRSTRLTKPVLYQKKFYLLKRGIKENDIIVILLMDIVLV